MRGVMTSSRVLRLPTAWSQVFWGIVLGGVYAVMADGLLFQPYFITVESEANVYAGLNIFSLLLVALIASVFSHLLLRRCVSKEWLSTMERLGPRLGHRRDDGHGRDV